MEETLDISYRFTFADNESREFIISLERLTLTLRNQRQASPPAWSDLQHHQCPSCPFTAGDHPHCPIAVNMAGIVEEFKNCLSYESVYVTVTTRERSYAKSTTVQEGLSSLIGIVMVTSGCPVMERLKPMVRFHLPFAHLEEAAYRMLAMYLVAQLYRHRRGEAADWLLNGLENVYREVGEVNQSFAKRLREAAREDANINALVKLDCFAKMVPFTVEELLGEMEGYFAAYLPSP